MNDFAFSPHGSFPRRSLTRGASTRGSFALAATFVAFTVSCASSTPPPQDDAKKALPPPTLAEVLPLVDRTVSSFRTRTDAGDEGVLMLEIYRPRPDLAELEIAGRIQRLVVHEDAVLHATGGQLLGTPLEAGRTFRGAFGTVRIVDVNAEVVVPMGKIPRCVLTIEESIQPPKRVETAYCAGIGLTKMIVEASGDAEVLRLETELVSHGPRVDLRKSGPTEPEAAPAP